MFSPGGRQEGRGGSATVTGAPLLPCPYMVTAELEAARPRPKSTSLTCVETRRGGAGRGCFPLAPMCCTCKEKQTAVRGPSRARFLSPDRWHNDIFQHFNRVRALRADRYVTKTSDIMPGMWHATYLLFYSENGCSDTSVSVQTHSRYWKSTRGRQTAEQRKKNLQQKCLLAYQAVLRQHRTVGHFSTTVS